MSEEIGLFEAIYSQRALRYMKPDPVPDDLIRKVIEAGTRAPNGGNSQQWGFIVIKDEATKRIIAEHYPATARPSHGEPATASERRASESADYLAQHAMTSPSGFSRLRAIRARTSTTARPSTPPSRICSSPPARSGSAAC